nr:unnamed protein product [Spirometra erinaceieuropaei]
MQAISPVGTRLILGRHYYHPSSSSTPVFAGPPQSITFDPASFPSPTILSVRQHPFTPIARTAEPPKRKTPRVKCPVEQREYTRRIKKQNMERRRRASISDKISSMYYLASSMIGVDSHRQQPQKVEKADILSFCLGVLNGFSELLQTRPDLQEKVKNLYSLVKDSRPAVPEEQSSGTNPPPGPVSPHRTPATEAVRRPSVADSGIEDCSVLDLSKPPAPVEPQARDVSFTISPIAIRSRDECTALPLRFRIKRHRKSSPDGGTLNPTCVPCPSENSAVPGRAPLWRPYLD